MTKSLKIILFAVSGFVGLLVLGVVALLLLVDANAYKSRLEAASSGVLGMDVRVGGRLGIGIFPGLLLTLEDVHLRNRGTDIIVARQASLGVDLLSLFRQEVRIGKVALKNPRISIEYGIDGKFNFEAPDTADGSSPALHLDQVTLSGATFLYTDKQSGHEIEAGRCNLATRRLQVAEGKRQDFLKRLSVAADFNCAEIRTKGVALSGLKASVAGKNGIFDFKPLSMRVFDGQGSGDLRVDVAGATPRYQLTYSLSQFHTEEFLKILAHQNVAEGLMDFTAKLSMQGKTMNELKRTAEGQISLRGENLILHGRNLDREFARYQSSQNFNLVDAGAFFFAGPVGLAVTKGYNFASIFQGSGGRSEIRKLVSDWKVEGGVALAQDVAMATNKNRIALRGGLDFANQRYSDLTMALINARGCATVRQTIRGSFQKPVVEKPNILETLTGPAIKLLEKGKELIPGEKCKVYYAGSVAPPK